MGIEALATELACYERQRADLVSKADGKFVLIKGDEIAGFYDTLDEALDAGYQRFGLEPFLARQVSAVDPTINLTTFLVAS